jgi:hypothetical protein
MKTLGWFFLIGYLVDAVVSTVASYVAAVAAPSSVISLVMMAFSVLAFVLSALGKLLPRKVFLTLTLYYGVLVVFGILLTALLIARLGPEEFTRIGAAANSGSELFRNEFPWFDAVHLPILCIWLGLAIYGLVTYGKTVNQTPASIEADRAAG